MFLISRTVAARTFYARKITIISQALAEHLFNIIIIA